MSDRRTVSSSLSARVIEYLRRKGHQQSKIAQMLGVSEAFVSLVKNKERALTIDHLELLSAALSVPLGALLLVATEPAKSNKTADKKLLELSKRIMQKADAARELILRDGGSREVRKAG